MKKIYIRKSWTTFSKLKYLNFRLYGMKLELYSWFWRAIAANNYFTTALHIPLGVHISPARSNPSARLRTAGFCATLTHKTNWILVSSQFASGRHQRRMYAPVSFPTCYWKRWQCHCSWLNCCECLCYMSGERFFSKTLMQSWGMGEKWRYT